MTRSQLVFGPLFVALGVLLLLDQAGTLSAWAVLADWWPLVVILSGLAKLLTRPRNTVGAAVVGLTGAALLLWTLGVVDSIALLWPVLLIALGIWLLARRRGPGAAEVTAENETFVVFGDRKVRAPAGPLAGHEVTTVFGDVDLDLRDATIEGRATLQVTVVFGDVDVDVPPDWRVTVSGPELLGDVEVRAADDLPVDAPVLHVQALTVFGDLTVRARPRIPAGEPVL